VRVALTTVEIALVCTRAILFVVDVGYRALIVVFQTRRDFHGLIALSPVDAQTPASSGFPSSTAVSQRGVIAGIYTASWWCWIACPLRRRVLRLTVAFAMRPSSFGGARARK